MAQPVKKKFPKWTEVEDMLAELQRRTNEVRRTVAAAAIAPGQHNLLAGIQGGVAGQYYHLTQAEHTGLTTGVNADAYHSHAHNATTGIQGGAAGDYFHMTNAQYTAHTTNVLADAYHRHDQLYDSGNVAPALSSDAAANLTLAGAFVPTVIINDSANQAPLRLTERAAVPAVPVANDLYVDDGTNTASGLPGWRRYTGAAWEDMGAIVTAPAGANTQVQYNNAGAFGADANFTWSGTQLRASATAGTVDVVTGYQIGGSTVLSVPGTQNTVVGVNAGAAINLATNNLIGGYNSANALTDGDYNVFLGSTVYQNTTDVDYNVAIGYQIADINNCTADYNVFIGYAVARSLSSGQQNLCIGRQAGGSLTTGSFNTFLGSLSGLSVNTGTQNFGLGFETLRSLQTGAACIAIGSGAMRNCGAGASNTIAIGLSAAYNQQQTDRLIAIGNNAMYNNTTGYGIAIGFFAAYRQTTAWLGVHVGNYSAYYNVTGRYNVAIGDYSLFGTNTNSHEHNVAIGYNSGRGVTTGGHNVLAGYEAGYGIAAYANCVIIGYQCGKTGANIGASNRLMIHNSDTATPLLDGNFSTPELTINGIFETAQARTIKTTRETASTTLDATDDLVVCDTDGGAITITLPAGVNGRRYIIKNAGTSGNDVTVDGDGAETIDGDATQPVSDGECIQIVFETNENWMVI